MRTVLLAAALSAVAMSATAASVTVQATDWGYYTSFGQTPTMNNLIEDSTRNNWFAFDLSGVTGDVVGATLRIFANGNYSTALTSVDYTVYDVSTDIGALTGDTGGAAAFTDIGGGAVYGATTVATPLSFAAMPELEIDLAGGLTDIEAALGGLFAVGGGSALTGNQGFLWISSNGPRGAELTLETADVAPAPVPLPAALPMLAAALAGLALWRRRA